MSFFSIIVPVYNAAQSLNKTLDSIISQTFNDYEVIIVNDGSTDDSLAICNSYIENDSRFKLINQKNSGVSNARNNALKLTKGEYIVFLDSDDWYDPDYLKIFKETIKKYPQSDNYWCGFNIIIDNISKRNTLLADEDNTIYNRNQIMLLHSKWLDSTLWNKAFKADIIKKNQIKMKEDLSLGEDLLFVYDYLNNTSSEIVIINKYLYNYTQNRSDSLDTKYRDDLKDIYEHINKKIFNLLNKWNVNNDEYRKYYNSVFFSYEKVMKNTFMKESNLNFIKKISYNNKILNNENFIESINNSDCYIHPLYRMAYKSKVYLFVFLLDRIRNNIRKLIRRG